MFNTVYKVMSNYFWVVVAYTHIQPENSPGKTIVKHGLLKSLTLFSYTCRVGLCFFLALESVGDINTSSLITMSLDSGLGCLHSEAL